MRPCADFDAAVVAQVDVHLNVGVLHEREVVHLIEAAQTLESVVEGDGHEVEQEIRDQLLREHRVTEGFRVEFDLEGLILRYQVASLPPELLVVPRARRKRPEEVRSRRVTPREGAEDALEVLVDEGFVSRVEEYVVQDRVLDQVMLRE